VWKKFLKNLPRRLHDNSIWSEKRAFFTPFKTRLANFESSWLKTFVPQKLEAFDIVLGNGVENPQKKKKTP
jgi:hypothetical protein